MSDVDAFLMDALADGASPRDLLSQAIDAIRPLLDRKRPVWQRARVFWAAVKNARSFAASDVVAAGFYQLADEAGLVADLEDRRRRFPAT
jgi:hypothetical protein